MKGNLLSVNDNERVGDAKFLFDIQRRTEKLTAPYDAVILQRSPVDAKREGVYGLDTN